LRTNLYLPGVFEGNPWHIVNGSLWTILIEVKWYGILLTAGVCGLLRPRFRYLILLLVVLYAGYIYFVWDVQHNPRSAYPLPQFGCEYGTFFCYGALLHFMRHAWVDRAKVVMAGLLLTAGLLVALNFQYAALYACLPFVLIWGGEGSTPLLRSAGCFGDFSYGIYLYAYPVQQAVISILGIHRAYWMMLLISLVITMICAALSWHWVERPALALKRYLRVEGTCDAGAKQTTKLGAIA
jgi:peptidoglycan/LPS O-acetylase OafA/YrhL